MYLRKIMVCNVTTFSYNRGTPRGALYLGNIGSPKDRCVSDTCDFFFFLGSLFRHQFHLWKPLGGCSGSVSQRPEVKIFKNEQFRLIRRFETRYGSLVVQNKQNVYSNLYSQAVTHPSTNRSQPCLTSVIGRELVYSR